MNIRWKRIQTTARDLMKRFEIDTTSHPGPNPGPRLRGSDRASSRQQWETSTASSIARDQNP